MSVWEWVGRGVTVLVIVVVFGVIQRMLIVWMGDELSLSMYSTMVWVLFVAVVVSWLNPSKKASR